MQYGLLNCLSLFLRVSLLRHDKDTENTLYFNLQKDWINIISNLFFKVFKLDFIVEGEEHVHPGNYLLLLRHTSIADTLLGIVFITKPFGIYLSYIMKKELLFDPLVDIVGNKIKNCFIFSHLDDNPRFFKVRICLN